jgi:methylmalonyl-CoA/ethylmalonyl-CoA epimerase
MEPLRGSRFFKRFFASRGAGVHHLTFLVDEIEEAVRHLRAAGFSVTSPGLDDPQWREVFIHPREASGTLIQLAQVGEGFGASGALTLEDVLQGRGSHGTAVPSP